MAKVDKTNEGREGGLLKGDAHSAPSGGIKAVVTDSGDKPVLLEGEEVIINKKAVHDPTKKTLTGTNKEILHQINTSTGGKPILKDGGSVSDADHDDLYKRWKSLVNMSAGELSNFLKTEEGKEAGLSSSEAKSQGISSGHESARWIIRMKSTPRSQWKDAEWKWAGKQVSFISRMSGNAGPLYDDKGNKTRKHTSLLLWGHNPEKKGNGGSVNDSDTDKIRARWHYHRQHIYEKLVELNDKSQWRWFDRLTASGKWDKPMVKHAKIQLELVQGAKHEKKEHYDTIEKVYKHKITPDQAVTETAKTHIDENPDYYEDLEKIEKRHNFTSKITPHEINNITSGTSRNAEGGLIEKAANLLRRSTISGSKTKDEKLIKLEQEKLLKDNLGLVNGPKDNIRLSGGSEQEVFMISPYKVVKRNTGRFYTSWLDYLNSIILHNLFFPETRYDLIGFCEYDGKFFALVEQEFIPDAEPSTKEEVERLMKLEGFVNKKRDDYYNPELGIILEDLHDENVIKRNGILYFIDTVFYIKEKPMDIKQKSVKELLLSDGDNENDYIVEGTKITTGEGPVQDTWEIVSLSPDGLTAKHIPKSSLGSSAGERTITYDQLREDFSKNAIQISGINPGDTRCLNLCIKAIKQALGQEEFGHGGFLGKDKETIDGVLVSRTQFGEKTNIRMQYAIPGSSETIIFGIIYPSIIYPDPVSNEAAVKIFKTQIDSGAFGISDADIQLQIDATKIAIEHSEGKDKEALQNHLDGLEILKETK